MPTFIRIRAISTVISSFTHAVSFRAATLNLLVVLKTFICCCCVLSTGFSTGLSTGYPQTYPQDDQKIQNFSEKSHVFQNFCSIFRKESEHESHPDRRHLLLKSHLRRLEDPRPGHRTRNEGALRSRNLISTEIEDRKLEGGLLPGRQGTD